METATATATGTATCDFDSHYTSILLFPTVASCLPSLVYISTEFNNYTDNIGGVFVRG
jgi:hypothetical protein